MALIDRVLRRARRKGAPEGFSGVSWYEIGKKSATSLVREAFGSTKRPPRVGYEMMLPETTRHGHKGNWLLTNRGGQYELQFHYSDPVGEQIMKLMREGR